ncbi:hypothetical protein FMEAI12_5780012 [Parafrankia sp. Ea1.12]|nr:hypothetical protein FMEAI12_5780012 [Parafrankia sp. Ea1.12]
MVTSSTTSRLRRTRPAAVRTTQLASLILGRGGTVASGRNYELGVGADHHLNLSAAFTELALAV